MCIRDRKEADHAAIISTTDYPALINYIQEHDIDGVFTGASEFNIKNMIELCEKAGLPVYASKEQWDICSNKKRFKKLCEQYEVPTVPAYSFDSQTQSIDSVSYTHLIQKRQGLYVSCIEEIAYVKGFIDKMQLLALAEEFYKTEYGKYLQRLAEEDATVARG